MAEVQQQQAGQAQWQCLQLIILQLELQKVVGAIKGARAGCGCGSAQAEARAAGQKVCLVISRRACWQSGPRLLEVGQWLEDTPRQAGDLILRQVQEL